MSVLSLSKIGSASRRRADCEVGFAPRGAFDLDTRRKRQVYLAAAVSDAGIMDIECSFQVEQRVFESVMVAAGAGRS